MVLRPARPPRERPIIEIARTADQEVVAAFRILIPQLGPGHGAPTRAALGAIIASSANTVLLARHPDSRAIIGTLTLTMITTPTGLGGWISDVVVDESARGSGSGDALMREALRIAAERGARHVDLTSRPARIAANRLYQRLGFEKRHTNYYRYPIGDRQAEGTQRPGERGRTTR